MPPSKNALRFAGMTFFASLALMAGCGGEPPVVDTAETIRPEPSKPSTPGPTPEAAPAKDVPKG